MNSPSENDAMASSENRKAAILNPRNWSIKWKARLNFLLRALVAIGLMVLLINQFQRRMIIRQANDKLLLLSDEKAKYVKEYFTHLNQQLLSFSTDRQTLEAFNQLGEAFLNIENDNYFTSSVNSIEKVNSLIEGFYVAEILPALEGETGNDLKHASLLPADNKQRILQYLYLAANPKPLGAKGTVSKADDGSNYSYMHAQYHPGMLKFSRKAGISDILFVDYRSGYVTYSVKKNLDYATNLFDGPYKNSGLGMAFKSAVAHQEEGIIGYTDVSVYIPAIYQPCMFLSTPIYSGTQVIGAVVFAIDSKALTGCLEYNKEDLSAGKSLKSMIVGNDFLHRTDDPDFVSDPPEYTRKLRRHARNGETAASAEKHGSTVMVQAVNPRVFSGDLQEKGGTAGYTTETGARVLCYFRPLHIANLEWSLITQIDKLDILEPVRKFFLVMIIITLFITMMLYYMAGITNDYISSRLSLLKDIIISLSKGERIKEQDIHSGDEIGQISKAIGILNERLNNTATYVTELGDGNIDIDFPVTGDQDQFGKAMNYLREKLDLRREEEEKRKKEDDIRSWTTQGVALFNDVLRMDTSNLEKLSLNIIRNIIQYLGANQGGLFLVEQEDQIEHLNLVAAYAYDRQKFIKKRIEIGEGLTGTCMLEKKTILTNKIPDNYITIGSGLGGSKPRCLLIVPLKKDEDVLGVLEVASFSDFKPHEVEFVEKIAESIASALITVRLHLQTTEYLERFQQQSEEMKAQDEELRQSIEELQATHEQMERLKKEEDERNEKLIKELNDYRKLLIAVLNEVPEKIFVKDDKGRFVIANKLVAENYNRTVDEILGKSDFDFYSNDEVTESFKHEQDIIKSGKMLSFEEGDASRNDGMVMRTIKKPFYIEHLGVTGLFGVQFDITDIKRKEYEAIRLSDEIKLKQKEIEDASHELLKEKALMDALMDNVPEHIYFKDKESRFLRFSKSMLKLFGLKKAEDLLGKSDFDFFSEEHSRPAFEGEQVIIRTGKAIIDLEEKEVMEDGRISWVNTTKMPLRDVDGNIIGTFGISKDITHIKRLQQDAIDGSEELKAQEEELRQNMEEMQATQEDMKRQMQENEKIRHALGDEKALLDALLNSVPEHIYFKDKQSRFLRFSHSMIKLFGLEKPEQLIGKSDFDFFSEEHSRPAFEDEQGIIRTGKAIIDFEEKNVLADGTTSWVNTTKMPLRDASGEIIGTFGISKDITGIKQLQQDAMERSEMLKAQEEELRQNLEEMHATQEDLMRQIEENAKIQEALSKEKALMDALMDNVPEHIYFKDKESRFLRFSKSMLKLFGLKKAEDLLGKSDFDFFSEEHSRPAFEGEQRIIKTGKAIIDLEEKEVMEDGRISWVNTTKMPLRDVDGNIIGTFGISKDITHIKRVQQEASDNAEELKSQEEELRQNMEEMQATQEDMKRQMQENEKIRHALGDEKALLDALLSSVPEHIYFKDKQSRFLRFSHSMIKLFGLEKPEQLIGKSDFDFFSEEHSKPAFEDEQKIIRTGKAIIDFEEKNVLADGTASWVNTTKMPLRDASGEIIGTFGISKDITGIKQLQQDAMERSEILKAQEEELRQNMEEMHATQEDLMRQIEENAKIQEALSKEKALMDALLDNVPEHIYFKDKESRFLRFSKSMLKLFGLKKAEDLLGKSDFDFFSEEHSRPAFEGEQRIIKTGKAIIDLEEKEVMEDGRVSWVNTTKMPLIDAKGEIIGTFGISKTITHIKKLEIEANEKAEDLRKTKKRLAELQKEIEELRKKKDRT